MGSLAPRSYPGITYPTGTNDAEWMQRAYVLLNEILRGKQNVTGEVTLNSGAISTTVSDDRCNPTSVILVMPTTTTGSVALSQWGVLTRTNGSFTIRHNSTSTSDCMATYAIFA